MPLVGITTETENRLPLLGRIYKGDKRPEDGRKPGKDLEYFRVEFSPEYTFLRPIFDRLYGTKPTRFDRVFLHGSTPDQAFSTWNEEHAANRMIRRCDNTQQVKWFDQDTGNYRFDPIPCVQPSKTNNAEHSCECSFIGRLSIILPDLMAASGAIGYFLLSTHSINDIHALHGVISFIHKQVMVRGIPLETVPFVLGRVEREIDVPVPDRRDKSKMTRTKVKKWLLFLQADREFASQLMIGSSVPQLPPPDDDVWEEPATITAKVEEPVKHNDRADLGKVTAERNRTIQELRETFGLSAQDALKLIGAKSFEGWTRPKFLEAVQGALQKPAKPKGTNTPKEIMGDVADLSNSDLTDGDEFSEVVGEEIPANYYEQPSTPPDEDAGGDDYSF